MSVSHHFDRIAIVLSGICIIHCLAVPLLVAALPVAAVNLGGDVHFHGWMLGLAVPTSLAGFYIGFRIHHRGGLVGLGLAGIVVLIAASLGHSHWDEGLEVSITVLGGLLLAVAHWMNLRGVRQTHLH
ncbi:MAG: MerC domain-containing protein [Gammaproteobacteria bacterium]